MMSGMTLNREFATYSEIINQPVAWTATLEEVQAQMPVLRALFVSQPVRRVVFTGCGTPYYLALTAAALCRAGTGIASEAHPASSLWLYPDLTLPRDEPSALIAISRSGETTEVLQAIEQFRKLNSGPVIAITCYDDSPIVKAATLTVLAQNAREIGLAQTRSFTSMMIAAQSVIAALAGQLLSGRFLRLPGLGQSVLDSYHERAQQLGEDATLDRFFFLGSHPYYGLACEAMLKMKEMTLSYSEAFHFMEFRHGPMALITPRTLVVGLMSQAVLPHEIAVLSEMRARGARTLAVTPVALEAGVADDQFVLPGGLSDLERAPLYLPALHVLDYCRTLLNGLNPDKPHSLSAVINLDIEAIQKRGKHA